MTRFVRVLTRSAFAALLSLPNASFAQVSTTLQVSGAVAQSLALTVEDLKGLAAQRINDVRAIEEGGRREERTRAYVGVLLRDLLDRAKLVETSRHDLRRSVVVATATDGYKAVFSWAELYLSPIGEGALVYYERDGRPLDDREGRIALISLKDVRAGPRHVRWLQKIEVVRVGP